MDTPSVNLPEDTKTCPHCQKEIPVKATRCPHCQADLRNWFTRHPVLTTVLAIIVIVIAISVSNSSNQMSASTGTNATSVTTPQTPEDIVCGMSPQNLKQKAQTVSYAQLEKDPGSYQGTFAKFTGQILQIQQSGNDGVIRLSVTNEGYGIWSPNDVVYVEYHQATTAVNGDIVTIYGMLNGTTSYTSQANYQITLPDMVACAVGAIPAATASSASNAPTNTKSTPTPVSNKNAAVTNTVASTPPTPSASASPTCTLSLSPTSIVGGNSATLSWTTTNTTSFSLDHGINFVSPISSGSTSVSPPAGTTYTGTATGPGGSVICTGSIAVTAPTTWHTTVTYNGGTDTKTSPFTMNGTEWRITYSCLPTDTSDSTSDLFGSIESTNGELSGFDNFANDAQCPVSNSVSYVYAQTPGQYYLDIGPVNSSYTVAVEDLY